jgi:DNA-binding CsgD family transcriptional regulator
MAGTDQSHPTSADRRSPQETAGLRALAAGDWEAGRTWFQAAVDQVETAEALEGLATAAWWLDDAPVVFACRERAYRLYRQRGDRLGAARLATWLGLDHYLYRVELVRANGWLRRAQRLLDDAEPCFEHGWLRLVEAHIALFEESDVERAREAGAATVALGRSLRLIDLEMMALALEGLALVSEGLVAEGMRRLDEATTAALAGEMSDPDAIVTTCCYLIYACERVRDFTRAAQWCATLPALCERWSYRSMFGVCRIHYGAVLMWQGEWRLADTELVAALRELMTTRPGWAGEGLLRLAELRRRQGRLTEASRLFEQALPHPLAVLGQAELALVQGNVVTSAHLVDRFLRRVSLENRTERAHGLEVAVRIHVALGAIDRARVLLAELEVTAALIDTEPLHASVRVARGIVAAGVGDLDAARRSFEDAVDLFQHSGVPFEALQARLDLIPVLTALDQRATAAIEARAALDAARGLGAVRESSQAAGHLRNLDALPSAAEGRHASRCGLTRREDEVLGLIARGKSNQEIAEHLFISKRTVERHISTIYSKIGAEGTAARAMAAAYAIECGVFHSAPS